MPKTGGKRDKNKKVAVRILSSGKRKNVEPIDQAEKPEETGNEAGFDAEKIEAKKRLLMWVGISSIMVIFFVAWIFNLKYQFKINSNNSGKSAFNWEQTKAELDKAMGQVKEGLAQIKQAREQVQNTLPRQPELTSQQIDLLKGKLMGEVASSTTATSTKK